MTSPVKALLFDVFGTVVDWRSSISRECHEFGRRTGLTTDWTAFADRWRALYKPNMDRVRNGNLPWTVLDDLHRMALDALLEQHGWAAVPDDERERLTMAWRRLDPWPDSVEGLNRLRRRHVVAALSNGNIALMVNLARHAGITWDAILGAEPARRYKPDPEVYLAAAAALRLDPGECAMVAAHNADLAAAKALGFATAFVSRPLEFGPQGSPDSALPHQWDWIVSDLGDLAALTGGSD